MLNHGVEGKEGSVGGNPVLQRTRRLTPQPSRRSSYLERLSHSITSPAAPPKTESSSSLDSNSSFSDTVKTMLKSGFSLTEVTKVSRTLLGPPTPTSQPPRVPVVDSDTEMGESSSNITIPISRNNSVRSTASQGLFSETRTSQHLERVRSLDTLLSYPSSLRLDLDAIAREMDVESNTDTPTMGLTPVLAVRTPDELFPSNKCMKRELSFKHSFRNQPADIFADPFAQNSKVTGIPQSAFFDRYRHTEHTDAKRTKT